jgi:hypothetical protein
MTPIQTSEIQFHANGLGIQLTEEQIQQIKLKWQQTDPSQVEEPTQYLVQLIKAKQ